MSCTLPASSQGVPDSSRISRARYDRLAEAIREILAAAIVQGGTRVPVQALFENLESGATVENFLEWFPGVAREQVEAVLEHAQRSLVET